MKSSTRFLIDNKNLIIKFHDNSKDIITINDFFHETHPGNNRLLITKEEVVEKPLKISFIQFSDGQVDMNRISSGPQGLSIDGI